MKSLEDAIGCWTTKLEYNSLEVLATSVLKSAKACRTKTLRGDPHQLIRELEVLSARINSLQELTDDAMRRCNVIVNTGELKQ